MACIDILSQLPAAEDTFANWIKFEDDVDRHASFNNDYIEESNRKSLDTLKFLKDNDEYKAVEKHVDQKDNDITNLFDISSIFTSTNNNTKPVTNSTSHGIMAKYKSQTVTNNLFDGIMAEYKLQTVTNNKSDGIMSKYKSMNSMAQRLQLNIIGLTSNNSKQETLEIKGEKYKLEKICTNLTLQSKVYELKQCIKQKYKINYNVGILIIYSHSMLLNDSNTLSSYGICNNSCLIVSISEDIFKFNTFIINNDINSAEINDEYYEFEQIQSKILNDINKLYGFICIKMRDLDILTYETNTNCIKMPCGHGITAETLYCYAESEWKSNKIFIKCPHLMSHDNSKCDQIWYYPLIRYILLSSNQFKLDQLIKFELLSSWNTYKTYFNISKCLNCSHNVYRHCNDDKKRKKSQCPICRNIFCWKCKGIWLNKSLSDRYYCDNNDCDNFENEYNEILLKCPTKQIGSVSNVPSIRSCPKCLQLINHTEACKHMTCLQCKTDFCFVCLKPMLNGDWQCGSPSTICPIAPRQIHVSFV